MGLPDVKERWLALGAEPNPTTPDGFDAHIKAEIAKFSGTVREANIRVE
jgi:hypothetical protein